MIGAERSNSITHAGGARLVDVALVEPDVDAVRVAVELLRGASPRARAASVFLPSRSVAIS